jgi:DNA-binding transcriptional LysR family regulator
MDSKRIKWAPAEPLDLNDVAMFVHVVDAGGFSAAARRLGSPKSSVSRGVLRLEKQLGVRLLHRSTRAVSMTESGHGYYARAKSALRDLNDASSEVVGSPESPRGTLRVSAPTDVGSEVLPSLVAGFVAKYPDVRVEVELSTRAPDLIEERYDVGVQAGEVKDLSLVIRKLQDMDFKLYAAPEFVRQHKAPKSLAELGSKACVLFRPQAGKCVWRLIHGSTGREVTVRGPVASDDMSFVRRAAVAGAGIALLPSLVGDALVARGELVAVLKDFSAAGPPLFLVLPSVKHMPAKVRVFCDFLLEAFPQSLNRRQGAKREKAGAQPASYRIAVP